MNIIEAKALSKQYNQEFFALSEMSFDINKSSKTVIFGLEGSGKSTLFDIIAGLKNYEGELYVGGKHRKDTSNSDLKISYITQKPIFFEWRSVKYNLKFYFKQFEKQVLKTEVDIKIKDVLEIFGISNLENKRASKLSTVERVLVALARSYLKQPQILLIDQPFVSDLEINRIVIEKLGLFENCTIVVSTQNSNMTKELKKSGFEIKVLHYGTLLDSGVVERASANPENLLIALEFGEFDFVNRYQTKVSGKNVVLLSNEKEFCLPIDLFSNLPDFVSLEDSEVVMVAKSEPNFEQVNNIENCRKLDPRFFVFDAISGVRLF